MSRVVKIDNRIVKYDILQQALKELDIEYRAEIIIPGSKNYGEILSKVQEIEEKNHQRRETTHQMIEDWQELKKQSKEEARKMSELLTRYLNGKGIRRDKQQGNSFVRTGKIKIKSDNPDKVISFHFSSSSYHAEVHEDNMELYNIILEKYQEIYNKNFSNNFNFNQGENFVNRAKSMGYQVEKTVLYDNQVKYVMKRKLANQKH